MPFTKPGLELMSSHSNPRFFSDPQSSSSQQHT